MANALARDALALRDLGKRKIVTVIGRENVACPVGQYLAVEVKQKFHSQILLKHGVHPCKANYFTSIPRLL